MKKLLKILSLVLASTALITASVYASTIATPKTISTTPDSGAPSLARVGENIFVSYSTNAGIFFTKSTDAGDNFFTPFKISENIGVGERSRLAVVGTNVYVVWPVLENDIGKIYFVKSIDSGNSFSTPRIIFDSGILNKIPQSIDIQASGGSVYIAWQHEPEGPLTQILYIRSVDEGVTFSSPALLSSAEAESDAPSIAASGKDIYVSWIENKLINEQPVNQLVVGHSTDFGATFSQHIVVPGASQADSPSLVTNNRGDKVFIAYIENEFTPVISIEFVKSSDGGTTFTNPDTISVGDGSLGQSIGIPFLAINNRNDLNLTWVENDDISFKRSTDEGATFSTAENVSQDSSFSKLPSIAMNNMGKGFVTWGDMIFSTNTNSILFTTITP